MTEPDEVLRTQRLDLHTVRPADYRRMAERADDPDLWRDRGFDNPYRHLVDDPGPVPFRRPRVAVDPSAAPLLLRVAVHRADRVVVGSIGFHDRPDADGMIEVGVTVVPEYRRLGLAQEMLRGMWAWVIDQPGVRTLRYTVSPDNAVSQHIVQRLGFAHCGQQIDEIDGPEDIYEVAAEEYRRRHICAGSR